MAVKTTIAEADFPALLANYDVGSYRRFQTFANGAGQTTVLLETDQGKVVLRYYENRTGEHVDFEAQLLAFLQDRQFPVPEVIQNSAGEYVSTYRGKPYILIEFIEGEHCSNPNERFDAELAAPVVQAVAHLHNLTEGRHPPFCSKREAFDAAYCWRQFQNRHQDLVGPEDERWFKAELDGLVFPPDLPHGICHADLNFGNFLFKEGQVVAVLDFDMSFHGALIYDIASLIYWWAMPPDQVFRSEAARFILSEYQRHRPLYQTERAHVIDALKLIILLGISWGDRSEIRGERTKIEVLKSVWPSILG